VVLVTLGHATTALGVQA